MLLELTFTKADVEDTTDAAEEDDAEAEADAETETDADADADADAEEVDERLSTH